MSLFLTLIAVTQHKLSHSIKFNQLWRFCHRMNEQHERHLKICIQKLHSEFFFVTATALRTAVLKWLNQTILSSWCMWTFLSLSHSLGRMVASVSADSIWNEKYMKLSEYKERMKKNYWSNGKLVRLAFIIWLQQQ